MRLAERDNPLRSFLLVSTVLGKHVPLAAARCRLAGGALALALARDERASRAVEVLSDPGGAAEAASLLDDLGRRPAALGGPVTVIGFAETATGLAHQVAEALDADWLQSTTRQHEPGAVSFSEAHSHAPDQWLLASDGLEGRGTVVVVDDELSTGATACGLLEILLDRGAYDRVVVACLVDNRPRGGGPLEALGERRGVPVEVVGVHRPEPLDPPPAGWSGGATPVRAGALADVSVDDLRIGYDGPLERHGLDRPGRARLRAEAAEAASLTGTLDGDALVLGCGEHLAVAQLAALEAGPTVLVSSTTRSPALVTDGPGYPLRDGLAFDHPEEPARDGFAYNVAPAGRSRIVVHFSDPAHRRAAGPMFAAMAAAGARSLTAVTLT